MQSICKQEHVEIVLHVFLINFFGNYILPVIFLDEMRRKLYEDYPGEQFCKHADTTVSDRALIFPTPLLSQLQGWPGCQKIQFFLTNKSVQFLR